MTRYKLFNDECSIKMKQWPNNFVDLTVTSPPYDNMRKYNGFEFDYESVLTELFRITKSGGVVVWVVGDQTVNGNETGTSFRQALFAKEIGFRLHDTMIYVKTTIQPLTHNRYDPCFEYMFVFSKESPKTFNPLLETSLTRGSKRDRSKEAKSNIEMGSSGRCRDEVTIVKDTKYKKNVWYYNPNQNILLNHNIKHTAMFPVELVKDHILSWSNENDIVLDPMMGSGTTIVAALELNRKALGIEISEEYFNSAKDRIEKAYQESVTRKEDDK